MIFIEEDQFLSVSVVAMETTRDPVPGKVLQSTQQGWPDILEPVFRRNYGKSLQLSHELRMVSSCGTRKLSNQSHHTARG